MSAQQSLIAEVESAIAAGSADRRIDALRRVTDLFMVGSDSYAEDQVDVFDDVISRLADRIETKARAELAQRLAPVANAPIRVVRELAHDKSIEVAGPVLTHSSRLTDDDLMACAQGQDRLLAISKRVSISETISDVLVTQGNQDVVRSVARNDGARFSNQGYSKLVERSVDDEDLAVSVGTRKDIPQEHFQALVAKASEAAFKRLTACNPAAKSEINRVLFELTGRDVAKDRRVERNFALAKVAVDELLQSGKSVEAAVQVFAKSGKYEETVAAISGLCHLPIEAVDRIISDTQAENDMAPLVIKAAGFSWLTAKLILELRRGEGGKPVRGIEVAQHHFEKLQAATAKRIVRFYQMRLASGEKAQ